MNLRRLVTGAVLWWSCAVTAWSASEVLEIAGARGGLCVHLGSGDGALVMELASESRCIVHGLDADPLAVAKARNALIAKRLYGQAAVEEWNAATLPYGDNVVNLLVVDKAGQVSRDEMMRVLAPGGVLCVREAGGKWTRTVKPRPPGMDDWPQWRHGADRNPVSKDTLVDVPGRIQWLSFQGKQGKEMLTAGGRNYTSDSGLLRVRDSFNGLPLWNVKVDAKIRPAATPDGVFVVIKGVLHHLDGATGKTTREYPDAGSPATILHARHGSDDILVSCTDDALIALRAGDGKVLWRMALDSPRAISIGSTPAQVIVISGDPRAAAAPSTLLALDLVTGKPRWQRNDLPWIKTCYRSSIGGDAIAFEVGRYAIPKGMDQDKGVVTAIHFLAANDGRSLKDHAYMPAMRHDETPRAFFVDGKVVMHQGETKNQPTTLAIFNDLTSNPQIVPTVHQRRFPLYCHPPVATERFFIYGELGFTDWKTFEHRNNPITRGSCGRDSEGIIPANGLLYVFTNSCSCFSMLNGVAALATAYPRPPQDTHPLIKGPAFGSSIRAATTGAGSWPMYRGDGYRTGSSATTVPAKVRQVWEAKPAAPDFAGPALEEWNEYPFATGPLTPPVIAEGLVVVAQPHTHRVLAYNAANGQAAWDFTANGRIDSAPTIVDGMVLFGSRSGWMYCLKAADGTLVWRLRLAPDERRIVHCGQVESPWPTAGSVLVDNGIAYASAGLHPLTDGGMRVYAVDIRSGTLKWKQVVTDMGYNDNAWRGRMGLDQDYSDLLVQDGERIALSRWVFDPASGKNEYLFQNSFYRIGRDGAYLTRGTWSYGYPMNRPRVRRPLQVGSGRMVFGINKGADPSKFKWEPTGGAPIRQAPKLFRRDFKPGEAFNVQWSEQKNDTESRIGLYFPANRTAEDSTWSAPYPGWVEGMVLTTERLFLYAEGKLKTHAISDGALLHEMPLAQPVWDGLAAADGRLYLTTMDGRLLCLGQ